MDIRQRNKIVKLEEMYFSPYLCSLDSEITINNVPVDEDDFGSGYDANPERAEDYCCGNRVFEPKLPTQKVLDEYMISVDEFKEFAEHLEKNLSFGACCMCS